jgi:hypothetical protein
LKQTLEHLKKRKHVKRDAEARFRVESIEA